MEGRWVKKKYQDILFFLFSFRFVMELSFKVRIFGDKQSVLSIIEWNLDHQVDCHQSNCQMCYWTYDLSVGKHFTPFWIVVHFQDFLKV